MKCVSCDSENTVIYSNTSNLGSCVFYCSSCKFYMSEFPDNQVVQKISTFYKKDYWDERNSEISIISDYTDVDSQGKRRNWISQYSYCKEAIGKKRKLLEIGVGSGQAIVWCEQEGFDVFGIEPDSRNVLMINEKLRKGKVIEKSVEELDITEKFEIIWMSHVLEHLVNPIEFLEKIKKNLHNNGIFFIEVPNCEHAQTLKSSIHNNPHLFHFSKKALMKICRDAGFTIVSCDCFRPATESEGMKNKIFKNSFPYYPRILTDNLSGRDLRIILNNS